MVKKGSRGVVPVYAAECGVRMGILMPACTWEIGTLADALTRVLRCDSSSEDVLESISMVESLRTGGKMSRAMFQFV